MGWGVDSRRAIHQKGLKGEEKMGREIVQVPTRRWGLGHGTGQMPDAS